MKIWIILKHLSNRCPLSSKYMYQIMANLHEMPQRLLKSIELLISVQEG